MAVRVVQHKKAKVDEPRPAEIPLQVTIPPRIKHCLDLKAVETGQTRRALVLIGLRHIGIEVTDTEISGRRGAKK
jgi:hypothetical protein